MDVLTAVSDGTVEIGLLDAIIATDYEDEMANLGLKVEKILDTNSGYGVVLSGGLEAIEMDFRSFIYSNQPLIQAYVDSKVKVLRVSYIFHVGVT